MAARTVMPAPADGSRFARAGDRRLARRATRMSSTIPCAPAARSPSSSIVDEPSAARRLGRRDRRRERAGAPRRGLRRSCWISCGRASDWRAWSLYDPPPLPAWSRGRVGLIGDAAHPILPFLAQGGAMAIEDAETLAALIARTPDDPARRSQRFESLRRARVLRVQDASRDNGADLPSARRRWRRPQLALGLAPGGLMMRRYDWLYGWNGDDRRAQ